MVWEEVAWFCREGEKRRTGGYEPCRAQCTDTALEKFRLAPRGSEGWQDGCQFFADPHNGDPAIHAVAVNAGLFGLAR